MKKRGVGYAATFYGTGYGNGFPDESRATVVLSEEGKVNIFVEVSDVGSGGYSVMLQIALETLDIDEDKLNVINTNSSLMKDSGTAAASRQTYNTGNAVLNACNKLKDNMELAIKDLKVKDLEINLKNIYNKMIEKGIDTRIEGYFKATTSKLEIETGQGEPYWPYAFGAQKVTVEVDDETGKVDIIEIVAVNDAGNIINPSLAEGQVVGGCAMGIGYGIMEEIELNSGSIKNRNFSNYLIPTSKDVPNIQTYFVEEYENTGPFGAKGLGESVMLATAPAIINAIYDAVGIRIFELPATPDRVLLAIKNKNG